MNYRHIYHAGNFADVFKHALWLWVLEYLRRKDKPFFALDTHAGLGMYDLEDARARKTAEAQDGIAALFKARKIGAIDCPALNSYLDFVAACHPENSGSGSKIRYYPGSPEILARCLRPGDRGTVIELHPEDAPSIQNRYRKTPGFQVAQRDGYEAVRALLPPPDGCRRGAVLIDPPFEEPGEFSRMIRALKDGHKRFATGIYLFWYPIKDTASIRDWRRALEDTGIPKISAADFYLRRPEDPSRLNGGGMAFVNPPYGLCDLLARDMFPALAGAFSAHAPKAFWEVREINGECPVS